MDADIFSILGLPGMDDDCDMDIVSDADISQFGHEGVLKFKLFEPFSLLRYHKLEGIKDYCVNVVLLDAVNDGWKDFIDVGWAVEVHEVQRKFLKLVSVVFKLVDVFRHVEVRKLVEHVSY